MGKGKAIFGIKKYHEMANTSRIHTVYLFKLVNRLAIQLKIFSKASSTYKSRTQIILPTEGI